jgi:hypothetical protein
MVIRLVPFDQLPHVAAAYIAACAVKMFQLTYDGDETKTKRLEIAERTALSRFSREDTRHSKTNLITSNDRLMRLKSITERARR